MLIYNYEKAKPRGYKDTKIHEGLQAAKELSDEMISGNNVINVISI